MQINNVFSDIGSFAGGCELVYKGDGECDDQNNHQWCDYDGGDCCGVHVVDLYCIDCECKDPGNSTKTNAL